MKTKKIVFSALISGLGLLAALAHAQDNTQPRERFRGNMPPGQTVVGKVTSAGTDSLVVTPVGGDPPVTVKVGESTRIFKDRQPAKLADIKTDETIFARGELKDGVMQAAMVGVVNPEMIQMAGQRAGFGPGNPGGFNRADLGKKFIIGEVKAINETRLTIARPDGQTQEIEVDENTSFKRGTESITLPDIKTGDFVRGPGELKNGIFVAKELTAGRGQMLMRFAPAGPDKEPSKESPTPAPPKN
jgi:Domain of unknown function (DUF5666)